MKKKNNNDLFKMMSIYQSKQSMELQKAIYQKNNNEIEDIKRTVNQISENQSKLMNKEVKRKPIKYGDSDLSRYCDDNFDDF